MADYRKSYDLSNPQNVHYFKLANDEVLHVNPTYGCISIVGDSTHSYDYNSPIDEHEFLNVKNAVLARMDLI